MVIERDIVLAIKAAKIRLRFDGVVLRLVGGRQAALANVVPDGEAVIFTITAPIRRARIPCCWRRSPLARRGTWSRCRNSGRSCTARSIAARCRMAEVATLTARSPP